MEISFDKYQGTGNDFVIIDNRNSIFSYNNQIIEKLCDRRFGIGADGLLLLQEESGYDFRMVYYNADGIEATFCGNGARCLVAIASDLGVIGNECTFLAADGSHKASITGIGSNKWNVCLEMQDAIIYNQSDDLYYMNTGTFHVVKFVDDPEKVDILSDGRALRFHDAYSPHGTNANFAYAKGDKITIRTYEKGVEAETLSCGTGVTASAIAASLRLGGDHFYITTRGGQLEVDFTRSGDSFTNIRLIGPAVKVYSGKIRI